jgi:hypothetical protein
VSTYDEHLSESIDAQPTLIGAQKNLRKPIGAQASEVGISAEREQLGGDERFPELPRFLDRRKTAN